MSNQYPTIAIVGNPNTGKTTLFNALTGLKQRVGNWAGVTVDIKRGNLCYQNTKYEIVDLPGCYSLVVADDEMPKDERISCEYLLTNDADIIINVLDKNNLARNLYLTLQLLEHDKKVILVVDLEKEAQQKLEKSLGCPVVSALQVKEAIASYSHQESNHIRFSSKITQVINSWVNQIGEVFKVSHARAKGMIVQALEGDTLVNNILLNNGINLESSRKLLDSCLEQELDIVMAKERHDYIAELIREIKISSSEVSSARNATWNIDKWVLNRFLGIPIFLSAMYLMFVFSLNLSGIFQDFFDIGSKTIFVDGIRVLLDGIGSPTWLTYVMADGLGRGLNTTISFIPVLAGMFFALAFLESSGYMARAAFVVDRAMQYLGLPGKSFVSMIVGFGCNVPAVMASRTLDNRRERIITIMMSPFMSCGARLAIYSVFVAAFFPLGGHNIIFALYIIGILVAIFTGFVLKVDCKGSSLIMELPVYRLPRLSNLLKQTWHRLKRFLVKAGTLIVPLCIVFSAFGPISNNGKPSILEYFGKSITPVFSPMGINEDNWPATVSLLTGVVAKEVVVGSLNSLYSNELNKTQSRKAQLAEGEFKDTSLDSGKVEGNNTKINEISISAGLTDALTSIPEKLKAIAAIWSNPFAISAMDSEMDEGAFGVMYQRFGGKLAAFSYLLFILLYFPCVSVVATVAKELSKKWAAFSIAWTTILAYTVAVVFYQLGTIQEHPVTSTLWIVSLSCVLGSFILAIRSYMQKDDSSSYRAVPTRISISNA